ncbi:MAG: putative peptide modification system cyclase [Lysobacterales bacterium]
MSAVPLPQDTPPASAGPLLRTLVLCDLVDSTALVERLGDQRAAALIRRHDRLARDLLQRHGGREIDKTDGFLVLFERPIQGVAFALDYQQELRRLGSEEEVTLRARVGIHVGDVMVWDNTAADVAKGAKPVEVEGLVKPVAARLASLALPGQILASGVAASLAQRAHGELGAREATARWINHGRYRFKGVPEPLPVYEVGEAGLAPLEAPPWSGKAHREVPWWRRPATVAVEVVLLLAALAGVAWWALRPPPAIAFAERDWVVLGDLHNATSDAQFSDSLQTALRVGLEQSRFVNVLPDMTVRQALGRMERTGATAIDRQVGAELALREHARALILPTLIAGNRLRLSAEIVDPQSQRTVATRSVDAAGPEDLVAATDRLVSELRESFGESVAQIGENSLPLEKVTTANIEALKAYTLAVRAVAAGDYEQSQSLLDRALEIDPGFALAWARIGANYLGMGNEQKAREAIDRALALGGRLSQRDRTYMRALRATADHGAAAVAAWRVYADVYPDDAAGAHNTGMYSFFLLNDCKKGLPYLQRSADSSHPLHAYSIYVSAYCALQAHDTARSEALFKQAYAAGIGKRWLGMADFYLASDRPDEAERWMRDAEADRNPPTAADLFSRRAAVLMDTGRLDEAQALLRQGIEKAAAARDQRTQWVLRAAAAALAAHQGRPEAPGEIRNRLQEWLHEGAMQPNERRPLDPHIQVAYWAWLASVGRAALPRDAVLQAIRDAGDPGEHPRYAQLASAIEARDLVAEGKPAAAVDRLQGAAPRNPLWLFRLAQAQALDAAGASAEAEAAYREVVEARSQAVVDWLDDWSLQPLAVLQWNEAYVRWSELAAKRDAAAGAAIARRYLEHARRADAQSPLRRRAEAVASAAAPQTAAPRPTGATP